MKFSIVHLLYPIAFPECGAIIGGIELFITNCSMKKSITALLMFVVLGLAGCGQTGALYLPSDSEQNEQTQ
ncbi:lipopeptide [Vibrio penaeicida]|uniref:LPS translocon maturation chaperone LptM n=1 Tax=Vibrio penaeicida TaxID=104609 RepID=UPI000CEA4480|nr:lipoprotein [Vibrio penaeicida]RTZ20535.1 lipopeptide [Vibrio penaeicida]